MLCPLYLKKDLLVFMACKANFLFSLELEYFSFKWSNHCSSVRVCDGRETALGRVWVWDVVGSFA